jgi:hypothetical protein
MKEACGFPSNTRTMASMGALRVERVTLMGEWGFTQEHGARMGSKGGCGPADSTDMTFHF